MVGMGNGPDHGGTSLTARAQHFLDWAQRDGGGLQPGTRAAERRWNSNFSMDAAPSPPPTYRPGLLPGTNLAPGRAPR